jgi:NAD+ synthase (glutamine-hydrolysing)
VPLRTAIGQIDARVGDIAGNVDRILEAWRRAAEQGADLIVFTELTTTGYPPEDLLLKPEFIRENLDAVRRLAAEGPTGTVAIVGYVDTVEGDLVHEDPSHPEGWEVASEAQAEMTNSAAVIADGRVVATYDKLRLPNYGVFDEARYFTPVDDPLVVRIAGVPVGVTVCEDLWVDPGPVGHAAEAGARLVVNLNASPWHRGKRDEREGGPPHTPRATTCGSCTATSSAARTTSSSTATPSSWVRTDRSTPVGRSSRRTSSSWTCRSSRGTSRSRSTSPEPDDDRPELAPREDRPRLDPVGEVWHAIVRATRDYCHENGFEDALVGLSGGIDSAVVAAVAADALGAEHVTGVLMPSPYSSDHSLTDAEELADAYGMTRHTLRIDAPLEAAGEALGDLVITGFGREDGKEPGVAYENLQSRLRGLFLMALSNESGAIVLTTGNKSEYAVGYATLYGDMAGGFAPIKDVPKLLVYELARWRNANPAPFGGDDDGEVIPTSTIDKEPSAELRPDQRDEDSLPPYEVLDAIVAGYVEHLRSIQDLVDEGLADEEEIRRVIRLIDRAEFKRRQAAPGPKVTSRAFGRERRVPMTNAWHG